MAQTTWTARCGSPGSGWWLDDIALTIVEPCVTGTPPTVTRTATPTPYLHDQYNNGAESYTVSANFNSFPNQNAQAADDFLVPTGQVWIVDQVDVDGRDSQFDPPPVVSAGVYFYADDGRLPGRPVFSQTTVIPTPGLRSGDLILRLNPPAVLPPGVYWVSVQENDSGPGYWHWTNRTVVNGNGAAWRNPGGSWGRGCTTWTQRSGCWGEPAARDQVFRLNGTIEGAPTATARATSTATGLPAGTSTATAVPTGTPGAASPTPHATGTPPPTLQATSTPTPATLVPTSTTVRTPGTPTETPVICRLGFSDVQPADYFYEPALYLYCAGVISGYADNTFRPYNTTTRGQLTKIVVLAEGWPIYTPPAPSFNDVPANSPFYPYIETAFSHNIVSGYSDGTFRPGANVTRGQLCKIVVMSEGWPTQVPAAPTFSDVTTTDPFYPYVETAYTHGIISGYSDRTFRPGNSASRGQICKVVYNAVRQE